MMQGKCFIAKHWAPPHPGHSRRKDEPVAVLWGRASPIKLKQMQATSRW